MNFKHFKTIVKLGLPLMIGSVLQILMHTMDVYFVSKLGKDFVAASSMGASIAGVLFVFSMLISSGTVALVARKYGEKAMTSVKTYGVSAVMLAVIIGGTVSVISRLFSTQIIGIYDPEPKLLYIIKDYVDILFVFLFVVFLNTTLRSIIQAMGNTKGPLYILGSANVMNIVLDYLFIMVFKLGIKGAAYATVISQSFAMILLMGLFIKLTFGSYKELVSSLAVRVKEYKDILSIGIWACLQSVARPITGLIMMRIVYSVGGTDGSAAFGIGQNVVNYFFIILSGLGGAITILVGQKIGEKNVDEAKSIVREGVFYSLINLVIFAVPYMIFTPYLYMPFNPTPEVLAIGVNYVRIIFIGFVVLGQTFIYGGAFAGAGDTKPPMLAALFANVVVKLSLAYLLTHVMHYGTDGIWIAITASIFIEWLIITVYYRKGRLFYNEIGNH